MCGFIGKPFLLPACVTDRVLALEVFRQVCVIDFMFCSNESVKKKGFFTCPKSFKSVTLVKKQSHKLLEEKLAHLGLVLINDKWEYNPFNDLPEPHMKVTHVPRPYWEKPLNPRTGREEDFVELAQIPTLDTRGPWHKLYFSVVVAKDNLLMEHSMYNKLKRGEE